MATEEVPPEEKADAWNYTDELTEICLSELSDEWRGKVREGLRRDENTLSKSLFYTAAQRLISEALKNARNLKCSMDMARWLYFEPKMLTFFKHDVKLVYSILNDNLFLDTWLAYAHCLIDLYKLEIRDNTFRVICNDKVIVEVGTSPLEDPLHWPAAFAYYAVKWNVSKFWILIKENKDEKTRKEMMTELVDRVQGMTEGKNCGIKCWPQLPYYSSGPKGGHQIFFRSLMGLSSVHIETCQYYDPVYARRLTEKQPPPVCFPVMGHGAEKYRKKQEKNQRRQERRQLARLEQQKLQKSQPK